MAKSKVYFTREITPEALVKMYNVLNVSLSGNIAVKLHSGEVGNQNFLRPSFMKPVVEHVNGTLVECNTAYEGKRNTTKAVSYTHLDVYKRQLQVRLEIML